MSRFEEVFGPLGRGDDVSHGVTGDLRIQTDVLGHEGPWSANGSNRS